VTGALVPQAYAPQRLQLPGFPDGAGEKKMSGSGPSRGPAFQCWSLTFARRGPPAARAAPDQKKIDYQKWRYPMGAVRVSKCPVHGVPFRGDGRCPNHPGCDHRESVEEVVAREDRRRAGGSPC